MSSSDCAARLSRAFSLAAALVVAVGIGMAAPSTAEAKDYSWELGGHVGYANGPHELGYGGVLRVVQDSGLFFGAAFILHQGELAETDDKGLFFDPEIGWALSLDEIGLVPRLGLGLGMMIIGSDLEVYGLAFGGVGYRLTEAIDVGAEVRYRRLGDTARVTNGILEENILAGYGTLTFSF